MNVIFATSPVYYHCMFIAEAHDTQLEMRTFQRFALACLKPIFCSMDMNAARSTAA